MHRLEPKVRQFKKKLKTKVKFRTPILNTFSVQKLQLPVAHFCGLSHDVCIYCG